MSGHRACCSGAIPPLRLGREGPRIIELCCFLWNVGLRQQYTALHHPGAAAQTYAEHFPLGRGPEFAWTTDLRYGRRLKFELVAGPLDRGGGSSTDTVLPEYVFSISVYHVLHACFKNRALTVGWPGSMVKSREGARAKSN